jgi:bifunctional non-homologous end joining protein LigD
MKAVATDTLPVGEGWVFEPKWDGFRAIVTVSGGDVTLTSRNGNDLTERFRDVARAATLAITTPDACPRRRDLLARRRGSVPILAPAGGRRDSVLVLFDLLELDGESIVDLPLQGAP